MCSISLYSPTTSSLYLAAYIALIAPLITFFSQVKAFSIKDTKISTLALFLSLAALAGLPPTTGFILKLAALQVLVREGLFIAPIFILLSTILTLSFYINIMFISLINGKHSSAKISPTIVISLFILWLVSLTATL